MERGWLDSWTLAWLILDTVFLLKYQQAASGWLIPSLGCPPLQDSERFLGLDASPPKYSSMLNVSWQGCILCRETVLQEKKNAPALCNSAAHRNRTPLLTLQINAQPINPHEHQRASPGSTAAAGDILLSSAAQHGAESLGKAISKAQIHTAIRLAYKDWHCLSLSCSRLRKSRWPPRTSLPSAFSTAPLKVSID